MRRTSHLFLSSILGIVLLAGLAGAAPMPESFADLVTDLRPSVVNISTTKVVKGKNPMNPFQGRNFDGFFGDEFFKRFFGDGGGGNGHLPARKTQSLGSGFIWDAEGHIITNNHVVDEADEIVVILEGGAEFKAEVIGTDPDTDVALLKIKAGDDELHPVHKGDSDKMRVGDWVLAIGNPFGYGHTVTAGIISGTGREIGFGPYENFIQTDASINPGNSGGPLFNTKGEVVGVNSAKIRGAAGIGFSIPINMARQIIDQLMDGGKVTRGWLGVSIQEVTKEIAESMGLKEAKGALVASLIGDGPAKKAGIERGDVIIEFDGQEVHSNKELPRLVASRAPGKSVDVKLIRGNETLTVEVALGERATDGMRAAEDMPVEETLGMSIQEITPDIQKHLGLATDEGVVVTGVDPEGPAADANLRRGDVIVEINRKPVKDLASYREAISDREGKDSALLVVMRGKTSTFIVVKFPSKD